MIHAVHGDRESQESLFLLRSCMFPTAPLFTNFTRNIKRNLRVGEDLESREWMVVTQSAKFNGWKDMDPALIPQFEEGYREEIARQLLAEHGI